MKRPPKKYDNCPHCGAATFYPEYWRDAFCDSTCYESYLERRRHYYELKHPIKRVKALFEQRKSK